MIAIEKTVDSDVTQVATTVSFGMMFPKSQVVNAGEAEA